MGLHMTYSFVYNVCMDAEPANLEAVRVDQELRCYLLLSEVLGMAREFANNEAALLTMARAGRTCIPTTPPQTDAAETCRVLPFPEGSNPRKPPQSRP